MGRLYAVESNLTVTGMNADHRLRAAAHRGAALRPRPARDAWPLWSPRWIAVRRLAQRFALPAPAAAKFADALAPGPGQGGPRRAGLRRATAAAGFARGRACHQRGAGQRLRARSRSRCSTTWTRASRALRQLTEEMRGGAVDTLVITAWNPCTERRRILNFCEGRSRWCRTPCTARCTTTRRRTRAEWAIPALHPLESWGDARAHDGTVTVQPLISPRSYGGATEAEVLRRVPRRRRSSRAYVQLRGALAVAAAVTASSCAGRSGWGDGFIEGTATRPETPARAATSRSSQRTDAGAPGGSARRPGSQVNVVPDYRDLGRAASETSPGCRSCPIRSTSSPGATRAQMSPGDRAQAGRLPGRQRRSRLARDSRPRLRGDRARTRGRLRDRLHGIRAAAAQGEAPAAAAWASTPAACAAAKRLGSVPGAERHAHRAQGARWRRRRNTTRWRAG